MKRVVIMVFTALLAWPAWAQEDAMKDFPGYVDFGALSELYGEPSVEIAVGQSLLNMVSAFSASEEPETAELFKRLKGVRIHVFETAGLVEGAVDHVKAVSSRLSAQGWEQVVTVNSKEEQVRIFMKLNGDMVEGITVMAIDEEESAFINVIGSLSPAELEKVMDNFDIDLGDDDDDEDEASDDE